MSKEDWIGKAKERFFRQTGNVNLMSPADFLDLLFDCLAFAFKGFEEKPEPKIINPEPEYWKEIDRIVKDLDEWRKKVKEEKSEPKKDDSLIYLIQDALKKNLNFSVVKGEFRIVPIEAVRLFRLEPEPEDKLKWLEGWINKYQTDHFNNSVDDFLKWLKDMIYIRPEPAKENYGMCIKCKELIPLSKVAPIEKTKDYLCLECIRKMKKNPYPEEKIEVGRCPICNSKIIIEKSK